MPTQTNEPTQTETSADSSVAPFKENDLQLELVSGGVSAGFHLTKKGIVFHEDMTLEQWKAGLRLFKWAQHRIKLDFAAYVDWGEIKFTKEVVHSCLSQLEFDLPNVTQAININSVPPEIRESDLTAEHFVVLARAHLSKPKLIKWAKVASDQNLSANQLKVSIAHNEVVTTSTARQETHGIVSVHGVRAEMDIWLRRVGGAAGILKQDEANIREIIGELSLFVELHNALVAGLHKKKHRPRGRAKKTKHRVKRSK